MLTTTKSVGWKERVAHQTVDIASNVMNIGSSIWYCTDYGEEENGVIEYDTLSNKVLSITAYPQWFKAIGPCCCHHDKAIYIVDGWEDNMVIFDTEKMEFSQNIKIPKVGAGASCIESENKVHIVNGEENCDHIIYDIETKKITKSSDYHNTKGIISQSVVTYQNKIIRFGGMDVIDGTLIDDFVITSGNDEKSWKKRLEQKLPTGLQGCGCIVWNQYLVIFGGRNDDWFMDEIFVMDLRRNTKDNGWNKIEHVKCPLKSLYEAVLLQNGNVHLFSRDNDKQIAKHYVSSIQLILGELYNKEDIEDNQKHDDDHKVCEYDKMKQKIDALTRENKSLKQKLARREQEEEDDKTESCDDLKNTLLSLTDSITDFNMKFNKNKLLSIYNENMQLLFIREEVKNLELSVDEIKNKLSEIKGFITSEVRPDCSKYKEWDIETAMIWIHSLEHGRYDNYWSVLQSGFESEGITPSALPEITQSALKAPPFNISSFIDRRDLAQHFLSLLQQNQSAPANKT